MSLKWLANLIVIALFVLLPWSAQADEAKPDKPTDPIAQAIKQINEQDNGVTINAQAKHVDIKATVCLRRGEFLEMFACTKDTREHESILVVDAMPSTIHLGLLLLGLEPGKPLSYDRAFDPPKLVPATGPKIDVFIVIQVNDVEREIPANRWVQDNKTKEMMQNNTWLFAGSQFAKYQDKEVYHADINGSAISLVNFGDDLLTKPNTLTDDNNSHDRVWQPRTQAIPKVGTKVVIRLKPQAEEEKEKQQAVQPLPQSENENK